MIPCFNPMDVLDNCPGVAILILSGPVRVLAYNIKTDALWLISLPTRTLDKAAAKRGYLAGPYLCSLAEFDEHIRENRLYGLKQIQDPKLQLSDVDRQKECKSSTQEKAILRDHQRRDHRYSVIQPLLCRPGSTSLRILLDVLSDDSLAEQLSTRARESNHSRATVYNWLHRYWAAGCQKNGLLSNFDKCGNPGQPKPQTTKLGRSPLLYKKEVWSTRGYILTDEDKQKLGWGYRLITHAVPVMDAYLTTCSVLWAEHKVDEFGKVRAELFPPIARPTFSQFVRWGKTLNQISVTDMLLGRTKARQRSEARGGSEQDLVAAVGQLGAFDGTSTDVYLTSYRSRLKKLPPMTRLILKEVRVGLIYGWYCSWDPPSPRTAMLAILHGALPSKVEWAKRFGMQLDENVIPGMLCRNHLGDHGELKGAQPTEGETQFGYGIDIPPTMSGDRKGGIESQHHVDHAHLDRKLPGTTRGKRPGRGDVLPVTQALWNYYEYMRELIEHIVWHNSKQEVPDLAPADMLLADPPIRPTRINIYHWLTERGMNVSLPYDYEALRAFNLPDVEAVIRKNGIYLEGKIHGRKQLLPRLRFTSEAFAQTGLMSQVKVSGSPLHTRLKMDPTDLSQAWLPTKAGLIHVFDSARNATIHSQLTLPQYIDFVEEKVVEKTHRKGNIEQGKADKIFRHAAVTDNAKLELKAEIALHGKPSVATLKSNLRRNRDEELKDLNDQQREYEKGPRLPSDLPLPKELFEDAPSPAELMMEALHAEGMRNE